jgi:hypothetical protein
MIFAILATGPSMSLDIARSVMGKCSVLAVSDAFRLAPWADGLVSQDAAWWREHPDALQFPGRRFSGAQVDGVEKVPYEGAVAHGSNSGLLACHVAVKLGARKILLCGFDMKGSHFFGPHPEPLKNTKPARFDVFQEQFRRFRPRGVEVLNCTPGSALKAYANANLEDQLVACTVPAA